MSLVEGLIWISHIALACEDIDRSVEFYRDLLGVDLYGRASYSGAGLMKSLVSKRENTRGLVQYW